MDLEFSLIKNPNTDDLMVLNDIQSIKNSVRNLILTNKGERIFQPYIGTTLSNVLFEIADSDLGDTIIESIKTVLSLFEPRIVVDSILVSLEDDNITLSVQIYYTILSTNVKDSVTQTVFRDR
jgi:phage baseplate assembly protein W